MMRESGADQSLCIYHAELFSGQVEKIEVLRKNMVLRDTTLLNDEAGNHALTYALSDSHEIQLKLLDLHNPGKDTRLQEEHIERKRPVGNFYSMGGRLYRPAPGLLHGLWKRADFLRMRSGTLQGKTHQKKIPS